MDITGCITNEMWQNYAAGRLDEPTRKAMLAHAASCEICGEMLEGIQAMKQPETLEQRVHAINNEIAKQVGSTRNINSSRLWYLAAAASLIIASTCVWYVFRPRETPIALRDRPVAEQTAQPEVKPESLPTKEEEPVAKPALTKPATVQKQTPLLKPESKAVEKETPAEDAKALTFLEESADKKEDDASTDVVTEKSTLAEAAEPRNTVAVASAKRKLSEQKKKDTAKRTTYSYSDLYVTTPPDSVVYKQAFAYYAATKYDSCRIELSPLINNPASLYYEEGLLLMAKAYREEGQRTEAKKQLQMIIQMKGVKAKEAEDLLRELK